MIRRILTWLLLTAALISLLTYNFPPEYVLKGFTGKDEHFQEDGCQDYTDYCKYYYDSPGLFENSALYRQVTEDDIEDIKSYFENFREWMVGAERLDEYDFDPVCINAGDYVKTVTKEGQPVGGYVYEKFDNYTVYFFDTDTCTLYYIHSNI
jgi:hypothetical protein